MFNKLQCHLFFDSAGIIKYIQPITTRFGYPDLVYQIYDFVTKS